MPQCVAVFFFRYIEAYGSPSEMENLINDYRECGTDMGHSIDRPYISMGPETYAYDQKVVRMSYYFEGYQCHPSYDSYQHSRRHTYHYDDRYDVDNIYNDRRHEAYGYDGYYGREGGIPIESFQYGYRNYDYRYHQKNRSVDVYGRDDPIERPWNKQPYRYEFNDTAAREDHPRRKRDHDGSATPPSQSSRYGDEDDAIAPRRIPTSSQHFNVMTDDQRASAQLHARMQHQEHGRMRSFSHNYSDDVHLSPRSRSPSPSRSRGRTSRRPRTSSPHGRMRHSSSQRMRDNSSRGRNERTSIRTSTPRRRPAPTSPSRRQPRRASPSPSPSRSQSRSSASPSRRQPRRASPSPSPSRSQSRSSASPSRIKSRSVSASPSRSQSRSSARSVSASPSRSQSSSVSASPSRSQSRSVSASPRSRSASISSSRGSPTRQISPHGREDVSMRTRSVSPERSIAPTVVDSESETDDAMGADEDGTNGDTGEKAASEDGTKKWADMDDSDIDLNDL